MTKCGCTATTWCASCYTLAQRAGILDTPKMSEKVLQSAVIRIAKREGWRVYHTFDSRKSEKGYPDLTLLKGVRLIFAELKREGEKPTIEQQAWLDALALLSDVQTFVWRPSDLASIALILAS